MSKTLTFYYDYRSPYAYLSGTQLPAIVKRTGALLVHKPISVLNVMEKVGNVPTSVTCEVKGAYVRQDPARWVSKYDVPLNRHPKHGTFPADPFSAAALAAGERGQFEELNNAIWQAFWVDQPSLENDAEIISYLECKNIPDAAEIWAERDPFLEKLEENNKEAAELGIFGAPSFMVGDDLFFGNDRLDFVEESLNR